MKKALLVSVILLFSSSSAYAAGYGQAGCGLGSVLFGSKPGLMQVVAATFNGSFYSQSFGITFGTSNCGGGAKISAKAFIETNRAALAKDAARGSGETVANLSKLAGCKNPNAVGLSLKKNFATTFTGNQTSNAAVSRAVLKTLKSEKHLMCTKLG